MDELWRIELLGWLRATHRDRVVSRFQTQKTGALLGFLAYHCHRSHPRDALIEVLWPGDELAAGRNKLRLALASLRRQLEPPGVPRGAVIIADRATVQVNPAAITTDVAVFEATCVEALPSSGGEGAPFPLTTEPAVRLGAAVEQYRGELLPGYYEDWIVPERERLIELYCQALAQLIGYHEQSGDLPQALQYARLAAAADPLRDTARHDLIRLLAAAGEPRAALGEYQALVQRLEQELGAEPPEDLRLLVERIQADASAFPAEDREPVAVAAAPLVAPREEMPPAAVPIPTPAPTGTVTFLLTDIEGSTALWERVGDAFPAALATHHALLREQFARYGGWEARESGDGFLVAFAGARDALCCAVAAQQALAAHPWTEEVGPLCVRMALHTGDVELQQGDYRSLVLHHAQRVLVAGHGDQILCSEETAVILRRQLPPEVRLLELGLYRLRDVATPVRLFQVSYPGMAPAEFPPPNAAAGYGSHLPLQLTRFFGREREIERLQRMLLPGTGEDNSASSTAVRLVTLTGPGGSGKTRLALAVAGRLGEPFHGAVWFVPLVQLTDPARLPDAVRDALHLPRTPDVEPMEQVVVALSRQPALLVLDNFEHLVEEGTTIVRTLLERIPTLTCLVTSRRKLNLAGERQFPVPPLPVPGDEGDGRPASGVGRTKSNTQGSTPIAMLQCASVQLFVDRAQAVRPDFQVTSANAAAVAALCQRLEGIPLALELAAARVAALTPAQMLQQLQRPLDFLVSRQQGAPARQLTVRAAVDWSYRLLSPELQRFFARLSVFHGGWTLEAAEAVCGAESVQAFRRSGVQEDRSLSEPERLNAQTPERLTPVLDYLVELSECSLVEDVEVGDKTRYRLLETLRVYGAERLQEQPDAACAVANRHARYYLELAEARVARRWTRDEARALDELREELDNLRAAMDWAHAVAQNELCARLAPALYQALYGRGFWEEARLRLQVSRAVAETMEGDARGLQATISYDLASLAEDMGDRDEARRQAEVALAFRRELNDAPGTAQALNLLGLLVRSEGDLDAAQSYFDEALVLLPDSDHARRGMLLTNLAGLAVRRGNIDAARRLYQESLTLLRAAGDRRHEATALNNLGLLAHQYDRDHAEARRLYQESLALYRSLRDPIGIAVSLNNLAELAEQEGDLLTAIALFVPAERMLRDLQSTHVTFPAASLQRLAEQLGAERFTDLRAAAERTSWERIVGEGAS
jgi:predicted ATPase/DNA-binding SARP family transcriptional activator